MLDELSYKVYEAIEPKASIVIVHGMQEHKGRYARFADYLKDNGYTTYIYDLPGHGDSSSEENRGFFGNESNIA